MSPGKGERTNECACACACVHVLVQHDPIQGVGAWPGGQWMIIRGSGYHLLQVDANWTRGKQEAEESGHAKEGERM